MTAFNSPFSKLFTIDVEITIVFAYAVALGTWLSTISPHAPFGPPSIDEMRCLASPVC